MATNTDPNTNTTYTTTTPREEKPKTWAWIAGAVVLLAIIFAIAMPGNDRSGTDPTAGTPPAIMDTVPPAATDTTPAPVEPAKPY